MRKKHRWIVLAIAVFLIGWILLANKALNVTTYTVNSEKIPDSFNGYRIAQISDLHNAQMGKGNRKLLQMLEDAQPDIIVITGDLIDSRNTKPEIAIQFVTEAVKIAPCYYVSGNHEARVPEYTGLKADMQAAGVTVLEDAKAQITLNGQSICLIGLNDPSFETDYLNGEDVAIVTEKLAQLCGEEHGFTMLLSHRPELFDVYTQAGADLVLCGHAHGGQVRLPFVGGVIAPNQGFFPEYDAGLFARDNTTMIVSRGIGNSIFPVRINNCPELVVIELQK